MQFGLFYQLPCAPGQSVVTRYQETLAQIIYGDELGFDSAWLAEAHFAPGFSVMPSPLTIAATLAGQTKRIRLGTGVSQLPLHHPLRVAEEAATVDLLSGGRLEFGVGRGSAARHFHAFGIPWDERTGRFEEALEIIELAWTTERLSYSGRFYQFDAVEVVPKPLQTPRPPMHVAANSPSTAAFAGDRGLGMMMAAPIHPWLHDFMTHLGVYREALGKRRGATPGVGVSAVFCVYPGADHDEVRTYVANSLAHHPIGARLPYEVAAQQMAIFGGAEECIEKIAEVQRVAQLDRLICWFNPGGLIPHERVLTAMQRFAEEVMPTMRAL
jgi:alkanesulfonate monooxygenase SsuD/methylene tetrahydromethanopterin reductase-like flavin-dependent oxidoreductase (luciferase family)